MSLKRGTFRLFVNIQSSIQLLIKRDSKIPIIHPSVGISPINPKTAEHQAPMAQQACSC